MRNVCHAYERQLLVPPPTLALLFVEVVEPLGGGALLSGGGLLVFVAWPHFQLELRFLRCDLSAFSSYCCAFPAIMDVWPSGTISKNKLLIALVMEIDYSNGRWLGAETSVFSKVSVKVDAAEH